MSAAATVVNDVRKSAGLSRAELARRAGVPRSTVTRIEEGLVDPTVGMLHRLLGAAQQTLDLSPRPCPSLSLARLSDAWSSPPTGASIDWTRLRATIDELTTHPESIEAAIATPPPRSGSERLDTLLAGMAEKLADDAHVSRPSWTRRVPALTEPWEAPGTPRMVARARASAPEQFRDRNIFLSVDELWRRPESAE
jgi:transcriptional regulator with XRE-family HTH domain